MDYTKLSLLILFSATFYGIYLYLEANLENFYIFTPSQLHTIALGAIEQHGNNTEAIVANIVAQLRSDESIKPFISVQEEWVFVSKAPKPFLFLCMLLLMFWGSEQCRRRNGSNVHSPREHNRIPHHLRHCHWHGRTHWPAHG